MEARPSILARLRWHRRAGIASFILLLLVMAAERRVAELHLNQRTAVPSIDSEALEGDEVRIRLIALDDDQPPTIPGPSGTFTPHRGPLALDSPFTLALGRPAPRGPPAPSRPTA